jgi:hypothetical protein
MLVVYPLSYGIKKQQRELKIVLQASQMHREQNKQTFQLQLLALVLTLALVWYSLNPAPASILRLKREEELPDEKKRRLEPQTERAASLSGAPGWLRGNRAAPQSANEDEDDFDWPDVIDG